MGVSVPSPPPNFSDHQCVGVSVGRFSPLHPQNHHFVFKTNVFSMNIDRLYWISEKTMLFHHFHPFGLKRQSLPSFPFRTPPSQPPFANTLHKLSQPPFKTSLHNLPSQSVLTTSLHNPPSQIPFASLLREPPSQPLPNSLQQLP